MLEDLNFLGRRRRIWVLRLRDMRRTLGLTCVWGIWEDMCLICSLFFKYVWEIWEDLCDSNLCDSCLGFGGEIVEKRNSLGEKQFFAEEKYFGEKFFPLRYEFQGSIGFCGFVLAFEFFFFFLIWLT